MPDLNTKKLLTTFLRRFTNLSGNNRSIFLPRPSAEQHLDLRALSFLNGKNSFSIVQHLIAGKSVVIAAELDSRLEANNVASRQLKKLQRLDHFIYEERGTKDLHVGWPFVHGQLMDGTLVRCPLIYFPVELILSDKNWVLQPRANAEITYNKSFLLAYAFYNQTTPATEALEENFEEADRDSAVFRTYVYQSLQKNGLEIHFNADNYRDELTPFRSFKKKEDFIAATEQGRLKLFPEAVLGIFSQAGSSLVPDYLHLIESEEIADLEELFAKRSQPVQAPTFLHEVREEKLYGVYPMDAWQENALKGVKLGHSLVVQGPPGTGKSQLISNLISDRVAHNQRVLLVCQKRVALDVVYQRLKEKRLDDFIGLVHDFREDRRELFEKMSRQIERVSEYKSKNNSLDAIQLERQFYAVSRRIDQIVAELEDFKKYLFDESDAGISAKQLYLLSDVSKPAVELRQELPEFRWEQAQQFRKTTREYVRYAQRFLVDDYPWRQRKSFSTFSVADLARLRDTLQAIHPWFEALNEKLTQLVNASLSWEAATSYQEKERDITDLLNLLRLPEVYQAFAKMVHHSEEDTSNLWLANIEKMILECFEEEGPELTVSSQQLGQFQLALYRSMKSRRSLIGLIRWELFSTDKFLIKRTLIANGITNNRAGFRTLENKLDRRLNLEHNLSKLKAAVWIDQPPLFTSSSAVKKWMQTMQDAVRAKSLFSGFRGLRNLVNPEHHPQEQFLKLMEQIFALLRELPNKRNGWLHWLTPVQLREVAASKQRSEELVSCLTEDFDALCRFDQLQESLAPHEQLTLQRLYEKVGEWDEQAMDALFQNSICLAWIDHIEQKHPELRLASNGRMELLENELEELLVEKESISGEILLLRAREGVVDRLEYNRLNNQITYRDLQHQLTKRKKIWPLRKVISEFEHEVFRLIPCWMASPESVSAIFPMREMFDLVIFDEASQCFAERGVPALYRGKQTVVAGDPQQLQPSDLYQARWEEDNNDPNAEVTSLLELSARYLGSVVLRGHYRSKVPALIEFSNQHFYGNKLQLLPDCHHLNEDAAAIEFVKVEGLWEENTNLAEAVRVVELIRDYSDRFPNKEIGVITFNAPQQQLLLDLLDRAEQENWKRPASLFVKNIENVQGDEKDVIIFSIGYARDQHRKIAAQFGSLNLAGGENRLNVAVTRAREKMIVVTSIEGTDLKVSETRNAGPKRLREFLLFAQQVAEKQSTNPTPSIDPHQPEWYLKSCMTQELQRQYQVDTSFSFADFALRHGSNYYGLLLTDDDLYFENPSAKSVHGLLPRLLREKNWKFKMLYSRNWWSNQEKFWNEIGKFNLPR